jgi:hypothetical protein
LAFKDAADYPILSLTDGTDVGDLVRLQDVGGGVAGLPAVDGHNLTNVNPTIKYVRADERLAFNVDAGAYGVSNAWVRRALNTFVFNEIGSTATLDVTSNTLNLPAGRYFLRARSHMRVSGMNRLRIVTDAGASVVLGPQINNSSDEHIIEAYTVVAPGVATGYRVEVIANAVQAATTALGTSSGESTWGDNIYTILEAWKVG